RREDERGRRAPDRAAEERGRRRSQRAAAGEREALRAPVLVRPRDRLRPLRFRLRSDRRVVEAGALLAPAPLIAQPPVRSACGLRGARDHADDWGDLPPGLVRVVAADTLRSAAAEEERARVVVRVRALRRVDDRMRSTGELELVGAPLCALGALVLAVA